MAITLEGVSLRGNMNDLDYWSGLYTAGIKGKFDIASANAYGLDQPPDAAPGPKVLNFRRVELLRDIMVQNGDSNRAIWLNEYGWNASPETLSEEEKNYWRHVTEQQQADWTVQGVQYARKNWPWVGVVAIWYFRQVGDVPPDKAEYYFRLVNPDFTPAPVYDAVKNDALKYPGPAGQPGQYAHLRAAHGYVRAADSGRYPHTAAPTAIGREPPRPLPPLTATVTMTPTPTSVTQSPTVAATATATASAQVAGSGNGNTLLFVLGGALVVAGLAGLGYWFMRGRAAA